MPKPGEHKTVQARVLRDVTTLPLYHNLAPNEMLVPHETPEKEFLSLAEAEGVADIDELNKILERAVNLKNFLKGKDRIRKVAQSVAEHYRKNVEPLGYKAFLVGVDRVTVLVEELFTLLLDLDEALWDYVIVLELLHFFVPNHGRLWKSLMRAHLGSYEAMEEVLARYG